MVNIDKIFSFAVTTKIMNGDDFELCIMDECRQRHDWFKWEETIQIELTSLRKRKVFRPMVQMPIDVQPIKYKEVFVRKMRL